MSSHAAEPLTTTAPPRDQSAESADEVDCVASWWPLWMSAHRWIMNNMNDRIVAKCASRAHYFSAETSGRCSNVFWWKHSVFWWKHNVFSKVFSYFPLIYVTLKNISARPPIYVLFSKYEDSFVFQIFEMKRSSEQMRWTPWRFF